MLIYKHGFTLFYKGLYVITNFLECSRKRNMHDHMESLGGGAFVGGVEINL